MARPATKRIYTKELILNVVRERHRPFTVSDLERRLGDVSSSTIRRALYELVDDGYLKSVVIPTMRGRYPIGYVLPRGVRNV